MMPCFSLYIRYLICSDITNAFEDLALDFLKICLNLFHSDDFVLSLHFCVQPFEMIFFLLYNFVN